MSSAKAIIVPDRGRWLAQLGAVATIYFVLAKLGLLLAVIHPSASPVWPATGFAFAVVLLFGIRIWPALFLAAFLANVTTSGLVLSSLAIGAGNTLEAVAFGLAVTRWSEGAATFENPAGVARFALISLAATSISATIGVGSLWVLGPTTTASFATVWTTWWLGDLGGALVVAPAVVLWFRQTSRARDLWNFVPLYGAAGLVGLLAFSPIVEHPMRDLLPFVAIVPLLWGALRERPRDTATVALILSIFAVWGTLAGEGPLARTGLNESFLFTLAFVISAAMPSLILSADVAVRNGIEDELRTARDALEARVQARTEDLTRANQALYNEIGQREQLEAAHERQRIQLLEAQRIAKLGSWSWDVRSGKMDWSAQLLEIYGISADEFGGRIDDFLTRIHPDDRISMSERIADAVRSHKGFHSEERIVRPDGTVRHLQSCGEVMEDAQGEVVQMLGICQDVTEQREAQRALEQAREQLVQAQKLETIGQVAGGIAHDFNNLLAAQMAGLHLLEKRMPPEAQTRRLIHAALQAAERGAALTQRLLAFARRQELKPEAVDVAQLVSEMLDLLRRSIGPMVQIETAFPSRSHLARVDRHQLELALFNLAVNARDAMPNGGTLAFEVTHEKVKNSPAGIDLEAGDYVRIAVRDSGMGMDDATSKRATEPFFTTKGVGKGTGLGLSMVQGLTAQSGGAMAIASKPGEGTTVTMWLPVAEASAAAPAKSQPEPLAGQTIPARVLVVDDDPLVAMGTVDMLQDLGHSTVEASSGSQALSILEKDPNIEIVITDQVMPGMTGIELAERIRETRPDLPIILATGYSELPRNRMSGLPRLSKPYRQEELADCIDNCRRSGRPSR